MTKTVKLYTKDDLSTWIFANYANAKTGVEFPLTLDRHFVGQSKRGLPWECLLARAIEAAAKTDRNLFPHPCKSAYVIGLTVYVVDRMAVRGDQRIHAVRYGHNFTKLLRKYDSWTKRTFLKHFGDEGVLVQLKPPRTESRPSGTRGIRQERNSEKTERTLRGAERRARDAGLIAPAFG